MSPDPRIMLAQAAQRDAMASALRTELASRIYCVILGQVVASDYPPVSDLESGVRQLAEQAVAHADALLAALARPPAR